MSKKSKKILAYLMFVAALCGTPAVSEARGSSGGQVATEKASATQRGSLSQSFISYLIKNYGIEALFGSGIFGVAKLSKVGDLNALAKYALGIKNADLKKLMELEKKLNEEKKEFGKEVEEFKKEKSSFDQLKANAINNNEKLFGDKAVLELKVNAFNKHFDENKKEIDKLKNVNQALNKELVDTKNYNAQLFNITVEDKRKLDVLLPYLPNLIDSKMSGEFTNSYSPESGWEGAYGLDQIDLEPYSDSRGNVRVALVEYNGNFGVVGKAEKIELGIDDFLNNVKSKAKGKLVQDATHELIALKDIGLGDFGVLGLARYSFVVKNDEGVEKVVAAYFPLKSADVKNNNEENVNEENEQNENNENDNINENENIENNENGNINENNENNGNVNNEGN